MTQNPTTKSRIRQPTKRRASKLPPPKPIPKLESEREAAKRMGLAKTTLHEGIVSGMYCRNDQGLWELAHPDLAIKLQRLRQLELQNQKLESTIESLREAYAEDVAASFTTLVTALRHSIETVCFKVSSDPTMQSQIFSTVRVALTQESENLKRVLGVRDGPGSHQVSP